MRALVLGAAGQLGSDLVQILPGAAGVSRIELSVLDRHGVEAAIEGHRPDVVFNCAAYNAVDRAEIDTELAFGVNSGGALNVAVACRRLGARLVHFSTNFVFAGDREGAYVESDQPRPLSAYGRSKLEGEERVLGELPDALVVRSAALFGDHGSAIKGGSFPERVVERARRGEALRVVSDQWVNPTYTLDLARSAAELAGEGISGVVHVVASGCCAWDEFARAALRECGVDAEVESVSGNAFPGAAARPRNGCLASQRVSFLRPWREALHEWATPRGAGSGPKTA